MFVIQNTMLTIRETEALKAFQKQGALSSANDYDGYGRTGEIKSLIEAELIHHVNNEHESSYIRYELTQKGQEVIETITQVKEQEEIVEEIKVEESILEEESFEDREKRKKQLVAQEERRLEKEMLQRADDERKQIEALQKKTKKGKDV